MGSLQPADADAGGEGQRWPLSLLDDCERLEVPDEERADPVFLLMASEAAQPGCDCCTSTAVVPQTLSDADEHNSHVQRSFRCQSLAMQPTAIVWSALPTLIAAADKRVLLWQGRLYYGLH